MNIDRVVREETKKKMNGIEYNIFCHLPQAIRNLPIRKFKTQLFK